MDLQLPAVFVLSLSFSNLIKAVFENASLYLVGNQTVKAGELDY